LTPRERWPKIASVSGASDRPLHFAVSRSNGGPSLLAGARRFAAALEKRLGSAVTVAVSYDYSALLKMLLAGGAELAWMPPIIHARAVAAGAKLVALTERGGVLGYRSALLVRGDSGLVQVGQLRAARAAWVDKASASGYLFPRLHLLAAGLDPAQAFASERFYGSATSACHAVARREADLCACFLSTANEATAAQREVEATFKTGATLRVLDVTARIPPDGFVVAASVDAAIAGKLSSELLKLHRFDDGRVALRELLQAERLAEVQDQVVRDLSRLVAHAPV
jgi:phosphonate transport system substrate-binding protein